MGITNGKIHRLEKGLGNKRGRLITCLVPWNSDATKIEAMCNKVLSERSREGWTIVFVMDFAAA